MLLMVLKDLDSVTKCIVGNKNKADYKEIIVLLLVFDTLSYYFYIYLFLVRQYGALVETYPYWLPFRSKFLLHLAKPERI